MERKLKRERDRTDFSRNLSSVFYGTKFVILSGFFAAPALAESSGQQFIDALRHNFWTWGGNGEVTSVTAFQEGSKANSLDGIRVYLASPDGEYGHAVGAKHLEAVNADGFPELKVNVRYPIDPYRQNCEHIWSSWKTVRDIEMSEDRTRITYEWKSESADEVSCEVTSSEWVEDALERWPELISIEIVDAQNEEPVEAILPGTSFRVRLEYADPPIETYPIEETVTVGMPDGTSLLVFVSGHTQVLFSDPIEVPAADRP